MEVISREDNPRLSPFVDLVEVDVDRPDRKLRIRATLTAEQKTSMTTLLKKFKELYA